MASNRIIHDRVAALPTLARLLCDNHEAWVVGSGAQWLLGLHCAGPRCFDLLVPFYEWGRACRSIPEGSKTNSMGGVKVVSDDHEVDVWVGDVGWFLAQVPTSPAHAVQPCTSTALTRYKGTDRKSSEVA